MSKKQKVPADLEAIVTALALDSVRPRWAPGPVVDGTWQGLDLPTLATELAVLADGSMSLRTRGMSPDEFNRLAESMDGPSEEEAPRSSIDVELKTGRLSSQWVYTSGVEFGISRNASATLRYWSWRSSGTPTVWVGRAAGAGWYRAEHKGNGKVRRHRGTTLSVTSVSVFEHDKIQCVLIPAKDEDPLVVVRQERFDAEGIRRAFRAVEFATGGSFQVATLLGVDRDLRVLAAEGIEYGRKHSSDRRRPPVPTGRTGGPWCAELFSALLTVTERDGDDDITWLATIPYLDALTGHLDGAYVHGQIALEAFCGKALEKSGQPSLVSDPKAWIDWVDSQKGEIARHARNEDDAKVLVRKVRSAQHRPSGSTVVAFFDSHGVKLPDDVAAEIKKRGRVAHGFVMSKAKNRDIHADLARVGLVQTLLAAAVSLHAGYDGPLSAGTYADRLCSWWPKQGDQPSEYLLEPVTS